jgi:hypothetical protein
MEPRPLSPEEIAMSDANTPNRHAQFPGFDPEKPETWPMMPPPPPVRFKGRSIS